MKINRRSFSKNTHNGGTVAQVRMYGKRMARLSDVSRYQIIERKRLP